MGTEHITMSKVARCLEMQTIKRQTLRIITETIESPVGAQRRSAYIKLWGWSKASAGFLEEMTSMLNLNKKKIQQPKREGREF